MSYDAPGFSAFFMNVIGGKTTSLASYNVNLRKADSACGGVDEFIKKHGSDKLQAWIKDNGDQFANPSNVGSAIRAYLRYQLERNDGEAEDEEAIAAVTIADNAASVFRYEKELQQAVRAQLQSLESGLIEDDGGYEAVLATGRSDILARDAQGVPVVIELKAGKCPSGAIEQVLGYAQDWADKGEPNVRAMIVAGEFSARTLAAAKRIPGLELKTYQLQLAFKSA